MEDAAILTKLSIVADLVTDSWRTGEPASGRRTR